MSIEDGKQGIEAVEIENALRHFRVGVRAWSESEYARPRAVAARRSGVMRLMTNPVAGWALTCLVVAGGLGVPLEIRHRHQLAAEQQAAKEQRQRAEAAKLSLTNAMNDDELLSHVDSDIAQTTPDAMQSLASLMDEKSR